MKTALVMILLTALGIGLLGTGIAATFDDVTCGTRVMAPGETCASIEKYRNVVRDYQEQQAKQDFVATVEIGMGAVILLIVILVLARFWRLRRRGVPSHPEQRAPRPDHVRSFRR
jgi:hypothetical protein